MADHGSYNITTYIRTNEKKKKEIKRKKKRKEKEKENQTILKQNELLS